MMITIIQNTNTVRKCLKNFFSINSTKVILYYIHHGCTKEALVYLIIRIEKTILLPCFNSQRVIPFITAVIYLI